MNASFSNVLKFGLFYLNYFLYYFDLNLSLNKPYKCTFESLLERLPFILVRPIRVVKVISTMCRCV